MKKSLILTVAAGAVGVALGGCFDVEQSVSLRRDLSGTAGFNMTVDLEPMIAFMAAMQHSMSGKAGDPTPEELEAARKDFLAKQKSEEPGKKQKDAAAEKAQLEKSLPPGIKLLSSSFEDHGTKVSARFEVGFDDVHKLAQIKVPSKSGQGQGQGPAGSNPYEDPFSQLKVVDEGKTLLVTFGSVNPAARMQEQAGKDAAANPEMTKTIEAAFKSARFAFRLETPFDVVETNATRRDGHTLYWEVKVSDPNAQMPPTLMARFKK
ncbi:MAG TPA: hypothetical protein VE075_10470 [Thermoanaerobaculia bacterium]|nr:hypothetical protein [Thermoanaerobaculia bacterium]